MDRLKKLREWGRRLRLEISALFLAYKRPDVPWYAKAAALVAVGYALSPIDLIPDFIPLLGYLDDALLLPLLIWVALRLVPKPVMAECRQQAEGLWENGKPKRWWYALPVIAVWLLVLGLVAKAIWF